jgi:nicotinate dehydrogenase subunit A
MKLSVNGKAFDTEAHPDTPLLYVLRNDLGLVGTRFGCGSGQCGACHVLVDGRSMASCDMPLSFVSGKSVVTVEGLDGRIRDALITEQAAQCGYCMSGIAVSASALLMKKALPSEEEIRQSLDKHLCRCGSHGRVIKAIQRAARG